MATLLALPEEILSQIFLLLPLHDICQSRSVCSEFNSIIKASVAIQYRIALEVAGLQDNETSSLSPSEKLDKLIKGQKAWRKFEPQFTKPVRVDHVPSGIYDLSGGIYLLGSVQRLDLDYAVLPENEGEEAAWRAVELDETYLDVGLCIDEHDLIAVVTSKRVEERGSFEIALHLRQFSTGQPHPAAKHPRISAYKSPHARPAIGIEIVGDNLVLILSYDAERNALPSDRLFVFEWRTGALKMSLIAHNRSYTGLIFLNEHLLLLPNTREGFLEVWQLPQTASAPSPSVPLCIFALPPLAPGRLFDQLSCRAEPNPTGTKPFKGSSGHALRRQERPYRCNPEEAIIIFNVRIQPLHAGPHPVVAQGFSHVYTFFVHRKSMLQLVQERLKQAAVGRPAIDIDFPSNSAWFPRITPWEEWGRKITRWIEADDMATRWITTTSGQRAVLISSHARLGSGSPIVILDFNPWSVKKAAYKHQQAQRLAEKRLRREQKASQRKMDERNGEMKRRFRECKEWVEKIERELGELKAAVSQAAGSSGAGRGAEQGDQGKSLEFPPLDSENVEQVKAFLNDHSELVQHLEDPPTGTSSTSGGNQTESSPTSPGAGSQSQSQLQSDEDMESLSDLESSPPDMDSESQQERRMWNLMGAQTVDRAGVCFSSPVISELPCVCHSSKQNFYYDGALVDEERILGIKTNRLDRIEEFEVHYFG